MQSCEGYRLKDSEFDYICGMLSRVDYVNQLGFTPFEWQKQILQDESKRIIINAARQSGKSTIVSSLPCHIAKYKTNSLSIVLAPTEKQAGEDMEKIKGFIQSDPTYPEIKRSSDSLIKLSNNARIVVVPATEKAARGYSCPDLVLIDEASRVENIVYTSGVKAMFTNNVDGVLVLLSTPAGKDGFFYEIWSNGSQSWKRYEIRSPWNPQGTDHGIDLLPYLPEEAYIRGKAEQGIIACYSPRHKREGEQRDNLLEMGSLMYRQEYCCEFVETVDTVFSYEEIARMFSSPIEATGTDVGVAPVADIDFNKAFGGF